jgi:hypothetical protein
MQPPAVLLIARSVICFSVSDEVAFEISPTYFDKGGEGGFGPIDFATELGCRSAPLTVSREVEIFSVEAASHGRRSFQRRPAAAIQPSQPRLLWRSRLIVAGAHSAEVILAM